MLGELLQNLWFVYLKSAPYLVLGLIIAGLLHQYVPAGLIKRFVQGGALSSTVKAALIGTPVPLCSCGVVPVALSLHREGAGRHSTIAFLIATPENGVDSMSLSYSLFGGLFTLVRLVFALVVAILCGIAVYFLAPASDGASEVAADKACCHKDDKKMAHAPAPRTNGVEFVLRDFLPEIALWILFGFAASAVIATFLPPTLLGNLSGFSSLIAAAVIGLPLYVCASASTPIALSLFAAGLSPGACLVFLVTGPATNAANIPLYVKEFGSRTTALFYTTLAVTSIALGWVVDQLFSRDDFNVANFVMDHDHGPNLLEWAGVLMLAPMIAYAIWHKFKK